MFRAPEVASLPHGVFVLVSEGTSGLRSDVLGPRVGNHQNKIDFLKTFLIRGFARRFHRQNSPGAAGHSPGASWGRSQTSTPRVLRGHIYAKNTKIAPKSLTGRMVAPTTTATDFGHPGLCARSPATLRRKTRAAADESAVVV